MRKLTVSALLLAFLVLALCGSASADPKDYKGKIGISLPTATHGYMGRVN